MGRIGSGRVHGRIGTGTFPSRGAHP
jgi:hypothetical protein